jgi:hypothetical protein
LSIEAKIKIASQVLVEKELQKDVAKEHRVSPQVVNVLVKKVERSPNMLTELLDKEKAVTVKHHTIASIVTEMNEQDCFIDSTASVKRKLG